METYIFAESEIYNNSPSKIPIRTNSPSKKQTNNLIRSLIDEFSSPNQASGEPTERPHCSKGKYFNFSVNFVSLCLRRFKTQSEAQRYFEEFH